MVLISIQEISGWLPIKYPCTLSLQTNHDLLVTLPKDLEIETHHQPCNATTTELRSFLRLENSPSIIIQTSHPQRQTGLPPTPFRARTHRKSLPPPRHLANPPLQEKRGESNYISKRNDFLSLKNPSHRPFSSSPPTSHNSHENQKPTLETSPKSTVLTNSSAPLLHAKSIFVRSQSPSLKSGIVILSSRNGPVADKIIRDICNSTTKS